MGFEQWGITRWFAAAQLAISAVLFAVGGAGQETVSLWVRATAWMSASFFLLAFAARPLRQFWRIEATRWLVKNRRYVGVSGAFAHLIHLFGIIWLFNGFPGEGDPVDITTLIGGGLGFVLYFTMALTSSDAAVARLGVGNWRRLHTVCGYYVWAIFTFTFLGGALAGNPISIAFLVDCVAVFVLRLAARARKRSPAVGTA